MDLGKGRDFTTTLEWIMVYNKRTHPKWWREMIMISLLSFSFIPKNGRMHETGVHICFNENPSDAQRKTLKSFTKPKNNSKNCQTIRFFSRFWIVKTFKIEMFLGVLTRFYLTFPGKNATESLIREVDSKIRPVCEALSCFRRWP